MQKPTCGNSMNKMTWKDHLTVTLHRYGKRGRLGVR